MKSGLGILVIDLDGTTQEIYEKYRKNGNLQTVLDNIKEVVKIKKDNSLKFPIIQTRMLVMKHNEHQIEQFKKISNELNVDEMELGNIQMNPNTAKKWLPKNQEFVYETYIKERKITPCHWPWSGLTINWDGGVSPCCIVDDQNSDFGNVFDEGLKKLWNNDFYISSRSEFSKEKLQIERFRKEQARQAIVDTRRKTDQSKTEEKEVCRRLFASIGEIRTRR